MYYRLSIDHGHIQHDSAHILAVSVATLTNDTPYLALTASYGVSFVSYSKKNDRDKKSALYYATACWL